MYRPATQPQHYVRLQLNSDDLSLGGLLIHFHLFDRSLNLSNQTATLEVAAALSDLLLNSRRLKTLVLDHTALGDAGIRYVS